MGTPEQPRSARRLAAVARPQDEAAWDSVAATVAVSVHGGEAERHR